MSLKQTVAMLLVLMMYLNPTLALADEEKEAPDEPGVAVGPAAAPGDKIPTPSPNKEAGELSLPKVLEKIWATTSLSTKWYLGYTVGEAGEKSFNKFFMGRGYVTLKMKPLSWFEPRITLDAHQDDSGDFKVRLKYLHAKFKVPMETAVITEPYAEIGMAHTPWFDYEEHINNYRMEGTMFLERNKMMNSADLGITIGTLLGRKLPEAYQKKVSNKYPGTWGSVALGVFNGGGYHASEENENKVFQSRISLRPMGPWLPNLQLSHFLVYGKGNTPESPTWMVNNFMASFEQQYFVLTAQVGLGQGNQKGDKVDPLTGEALDFFGYSFFGEVKLPWIRSSAILRVDRFDWNTEGDPSASTRIIAGYAFHFAQKNFVLLSMDRVTHVEEMIPMDWQAKLTLQVVFPTKSK